MRITPTCPIETLLNGSRCDLQYCPDCKVIHLALGPVTLHLPETHFQELVTELRKGVFKLKSGKLASDDLFNDSIVRLHS